MDDEKPSTRQFVLKPKDIKPINAPARPDDPGAISVEAIHEQNRLADERRRREKSRFVQPADDAPVPVESDVTGHVLRPKEIERLNTPAKPDDEDAIHVPSILKENTTVEQESGYAALTHRKRRMSRRTRDFFLVVIPFDLTVFAVMRSQSNPAVLIFGIGAMVLATVSGAWIMFFVMDDY